MANFQRVEQSRVQSSESLFSRSLDGQRRNSGPLNQEFSGSSKASSSSGKSRGLTSMVGGLFKKSKSTASSHDFPNTSRSDPIHSSGSSFRSDDYSSQRLSGDVPTPGRKKKGVVQCVFQGIKNFARDRASPPSFVTHYPPEKEQYSPPREHMMDGRRVTDQLTASQIQELLAEQRRTWNVDGTPLEKPEPIFKKALSKSTAAAASAAAPESSGPEDKISPDGFNRALVKMKSNISGELVPGRVPSPPRGSPPKQSGAKKTAPTSKGKGAANNSPSESSGDSPNTIENSYTNMKIRRDERLKAAEAYKS